MSTPLARPPAFTYERDEDTWVLRCDDVPIEQLAARFGSPLYVYSASTIRERFRVFDRAFRRMPHTVCYSVKANPNLNLLRFLAGLGSGFDVVSGGELQRVLRAKRGAGKSVVFSGVGKTAEEIDDALAAGILLFNVESAGELEMLASRAAARRKKAPLALRVNPDVAVE